jgi:hypothetical protein
MLWYTDLELKGEADGVSGTSSQSVRKNIALHLKQQTGGAKTKKAANKQRQSELQDDRHSSHSSKEEFQLSSMKGPTEPIHQNQRLRWFHKVTSLQLLSIY